MALAGKTSNKFYVTSGGGGDEVDSTRKTNLDAFNTADAAVGYKQLIDDNTLGPLIVNLQEMQDDIDELRRFVVSASELKGAIGTLPIAGGGTGSTSTTYCDLTSNVTGALPNANVAADLTITAGTIENTPIGASTANTIKGTTIDATTDFTIGTTVITDDSIVMTPSTNDTVTIAAGTHGALDITTVDTAGAAANIQITADGKGELAGSLVTLDSGGDISLETGAVTNYVNTTGVLRSGNQGDIQYVSSIYYIPFTATDFQGHHDTRSGGDGWGINTVGAWESPGRGPGYVEKLIPLGFKATGCIVYGDADGSGDNTFIGYEGSIALATNTAQGTATIVNVASDFTTQSGADIVGDGLKTCRVKVTINESRDTLFGGKIILEKV